jgi:hypothetical protein
MDRSINRRGPVAKWLAFVDETCNDGPLHVQEPMSIIAEELALLERVTAALAESPTSAPPSEAALIEELAGLQEALRAGEKAEDQAALLKK